MNLLEVAYFIGNTLVAILAPVLLLLGLRQFTHAENTRRASVYLEVSKRYNDDLMRYSRGRLAQIVEEHRVRGRADESLSQYTNELMEQLRARQNHDRRIGIFDSPTEYGKRMMILSFIEDLGVLVDRDYLRKQDLFDLMSSTILLAEQVYKDHIKALRKSSASTHLFANALKLMEDARNAANSLNSYNKGEYMITAADAQQ